MVLNRFTLTIIATLGVVFGIWWYISSLKSDISDRDIKITELQKDVADRDLEISYNKLDITKMKASIAKRNSEIDKLRGDSEKLQIELIEWKNKPPIIKYKDKVVEKIVYTTNNPSDDICKDYIDIVDALGGVRYEDF